MMSGFRFCLLLAIGAVLVASASGASTPAAPRESSAGPRVEAFKVWDAFKPQSRVKRNSFLGSFGWFVGNIYLWKARMLKYLFGIIEMPFNWMTNKVAGWARYFNNETPGNAAKHIIRWNPFA